MKTKEQCPWLDYATFNDEGIIIGFKDDTPDEVKEAYQEHLDYIGKCNQKHIRIEK